ncbi:alpha/beta fold hydrolase [Psychrosphaera aestuarii]|uniref:alpha/beta fold hydrolase n=1 Tax=Psychrosphaera aestuarii TaxID=1266052 RepID=UPI001B325341|nr:alpha/beta hydrolase [Psychrosphaera aestuarii]
MKKMTLLMAALLIKSLCANAEPSLTQTPADNNKNNTTQQSMQTKEGLPASCINSEVTGQGKPIILIPGFSNDQRVWKAQTKALSKTHQVHLISLAGYAGQSPCLYKSGFLSTVSEQLIDYIENNKLQDVTLVGHSLGGLLSMKLAIEKPNLFSHIISVDGLPFIGPIFTRDNNTEINDIAFQAKQIKTMYKQASPSQIEFMTQQGMAVQTNSLTGQKEILDMAKTSDSATLGDSIFDVMSTDLRPDLHKITSKLLLIGASGGFSSQAEHQYIKALYQAQLFDKVDAELVMNTNAKHFVMYDDSDWLTDRIIDFISVKNSNVNFNKSNHSIISKKGN